jgi:hypothetical protein
MTRVSVFGLLGPFVGFCVFLALAGGLNGSLGRYQSELPKALLLLLPFVFLAGFVPSILAALFDRMLDRRGKRGVEKYLLTGLCGYLATYLLLIENVFEAEPMIPASAKWGLIGLIPATICSWLMERINNLRERKR